MTILAHQPGTRMRNRRWRAPFILGVLLVIFGVFGLVNPSIMMIGIGLVAGLCIIAMGASVIALAV